VEEHSAAGAGDRGGDGEQSQPEPFGFPPAGLVVGQGEHLHPGGDLDGQRDDGAPDLVLVESLQGYLESAEECP
jgi:hypothetical protein